MKKRKKHGKTRLAAKIARIFAAVLLSASSFTLASVSAAATAVPDEFFAANGQAFALADTSNTKLTARGADGYVQTSDAPDSVRRYDVCVFGIVPVKTVTVKYGQRRSVALSGESFGIRLYSDGVMVVGFSEIEGANGDRRSPAYDAGLRTGDVIKSVDGIAVSENSQVTDIVEKSGGRALTVRFARAGREFTASVTPIKSQSGYKAGIWVRDSVAGIGTLTYLDYDSMTFAGLGHGITDADTGEIYPIAGGSAVKAEITDAAKGERGAPGELIGYFTDEYIGELIANTETGVYGTIESAPSEAPATVEIAYKQEVEEGEAYILTSVGDGVKRYSVMIEKISYNSAKTKNMVIRVTDDELIAKTGGIVQGMSGSPIVQNGKLVGAVTHVFVNDPTRGYAIFAENMTENGENLLKKAA